MTQTASTDKRQSKKMKARFSPRAAAVLFVVIVIIAAAVIITVKVGQWRNDGARYAAALSEQIGISTETAKKASRVSLKTDSEYANINMAAAETYSHLFESKKTVEVSGVTIPEWVIYTGTVNDVITEVCYYDYKQLKTYGNGVETADHIGAQGISTNMDPAGVQEYIGFAPLCTKYTSTEIVETYKYYYEDANTGNTISYLLHVTYQNGKAVSAAEQENNFILSVLTLQ